MSEEARRRALAASVAPGADIDMPYEEAQAVSDQDRLAEIKATLHHWDAMYAQHGLAPLPPAVAAQESARHLNRAQIDWLVEQAEKANRLRDLLGRLEWGGDYVNHEAPEQDCCPACGGSPVNGHASGCWLAAELRPGTPNDPPQLPKE